MSGPKVSVYDLTPEQRAIIAAELQRRMRELEKRQELLNELHTCVPKVECLSQSLSQFDLVAQEETLHLGTSTLSIKISEVKLAIQNLVNLMSASAELEDNTKLSKNVTNIQKQIKQLQEAIDGISRQAASTAEELQGVLSSQICELFALQSHSEVKLDSADVHELQFEALQSYAEHKYIPESLRQQIYELSERRSRIPAESADSFFAVEVQPIVKRCEEFLDLWEAHGAQYESLLQRYELLAKENGRTELAVVSFSANAIDEIARLIAIEEVECQHQAESAYIEDSISSVMEEMGYSIRGQRDVTRRNGSHYSSSLFQYSQDSAVNVIFSDDGRITMEVGKTDLCDRIPGSDESQAIVATMEAFCDDFAEIERRLASKGVILKNRIRLNPPSSDFAQIINVTDFTNISQKDVATGKRKTVKKAKLRALQS